MWTKANTLEFSKKCCDGEGGDASNHRPGNPARRSDEKRHNHRACQECKGCYIGDKPPIAPLG